MNEIDALKRANREDCIVVWAMPFSESMLGEKKLVAGVAIDLSKSPMIANAKAAMPRATEAALFFAAVSDPALAKRLSGSMVQWLLDNDKNPDGHAKPPAAFEEELAMRFNVAFSRRKLPIDSEWGCPAPCLIAMEDEPPSFFMSMPMSMRDNMPAFAEHARAQFEAAAIEIFGSGAVLASDVKIADNERQAKMARNFSALAGFAWERRVLLEAAQNHPSEPQSARPIRSPRSL